MFKTETKVEVLKTTVLVIEQDDSVPGRLLVSNKRENSASNQSVSSNASSHIDDEVPSDLMGGRSIPKGMDINKCVDYYPRYIGDEPAGSSTESLRSNNYSPNFFGRPTNLFPALNLQESNRVHYSRQQHSHLEPMPDGTDHQFSP